MLGMLGGNKETVESIRGSLGKTIESVRLDENKLRFHFTDGSKLDIWDGGQSCCEHRYMATDDDLTTFAGDKFVNIELKDAPAQTGEYGDEHEIQFLDITTEKGFFQMANHNEHNGYYGGFWIEATASIS